MIDRARGMVLGAAVGDALGAGYEFARIDENLVPDMIGGGLGPFAPGEWTDDTSLTWVVVEAAASYNDLSSQNALDQIAQGFRAWFDTKPPDIGYTTSRAIRAGSTARKQREAARAAQGVSNGSLMRTSPVVLRYLDDPVGLVKAASEVSALTHAAPEAVESCVVWSLLLRKAVVDGTLDVDEPLRYLDRWQRGYWSMNLNEACNSTPARWFDNGYATVALRAALSSVYSTPNYDFVESLYTAIRIGHDTDTVASIAGALVGALNGIDAIPSHWLDMLHGYPGKTAEDLDSLVVSALS